jgi:hypothetical protein
MVDRINNIAWQAGQGSVAAIIQILNQKLANSGVRVRAVFVDGVLQLLCEAQIVENLDKSILVPQIQGTLEEIAPRNIYRVNIHSRIVREQQLLWLEEIHRSSENQLIWSEEIYLEKPGILKKFSQNFQQRKSEITKFNLPKSYNSHPVTSSRSERYKAPWVWLSTILIACALAASWGLYTFFSNKSKFPISSENSTTIAPTVNTSQNSVDSATKTSEENFLAAVRIANDATLAGKSAKNKTQWLELAANWQRASQLMDKVQPDYHRYEEAKIRAKLYRQYSGTAQEEADKSKSQ